MVFCKKENEKSNVSKWKDHFNLVLNQGGPGFCHFAITNLCDARCGFCNFAVGKLKPTEIRSVSYQEGIDSIDIFYETGIRYILFVGGEPLLHKNIFKFIEYAHGKGMTAMICTNGGCLSVDVTHKLKQSGLDDIIISIDAPSEEIHEKNRNLKGVCKKIREANRELKKLQIHTTASVTISKLISDYWLLPSFLRSMGFSNVTFSYPLNALNSSYLGFAESKLVQYSPDELFAVFETLKKLKKKFHILNNDVSLTEMQRFLRKKPQLFPCLGGYRYFYIDWNLDVFRCHFWESPMCKVSELTPDNFIRDHCNRCMIDCYRDPSVMQHIAISITDAYLLSKKKEYWQALKCLLKKNNFLSLKAVLEQFFWISKV